MFRILLPTASLMCVLLLALTAARAQDEKPDPGVEATQRVLKKAEEEYRLFIKRPETVLEYWAAMKYEIQLGKFDLAGLHLKLLLDRHDKKPAEGNKDLLKLEAAEGLAAILRLRNIKQWSDHPPFQKEAVENVEKLVDRVTGAIEKQLGDPERIQKFIKRLDAPTPEERAFARMQLMKSGVRAVPYLVEGLRVQFGKALHDRIRDLMLEMDSSIVPGYLEVFKAHDAKEAQELEPRRTLLDITVKRDDARVVPYLWHLSSSPQYPEAMRKQALRALGFFLKSDIQNLPPAKIALTQLAQDYYYHRVRFPAKDVRIWPWDGSQITTKPIDLSGAQAEEFFGLRYAREALSLDAKYQPAQVVLLSLMLERFLEPDLDQLLLRPAPVQLKDLLVRTDPELVGVVLERAMDDHKVPIILATVQALGDRGDPRSAKLSAGGAPRGLLRALYYPDRRVQYAAAQATLRMPAVVPVAAARVVDIFRRFVAADPAAPRALAAYTPAEMADATRRDLKAVGYTAELARNLQEAFEKLRVSADYDFIVLQRALPEKELPFVLSQLRGDNDQGGLPIFIVAAKDRQEALDKLARKYRAVQAIPVPVLGMPDELKARIETLTKASQGAKLTPEERKEFSRAALNALWQMARGEIAGYDVRPATEAVLGALRSPDTALQALEILGRLPGTATQHRLAALVTDPAAAKLRIPAAKELNRHIQKYGVLLGKKYAGDLKATYQTADDLTLKGELAVGMGLMRTPTPGQVGAQLFEFRPALATQPMEEKEEKKEKEKEKK